jgi:hypothetical protein
MARPGAAGMDPFDRPTVPAWSFTADKGHKMDLSTLPLTPLVSLVAGVLILIMPRLLNYIVALYLIVVGLIGLFPNLAG